MDEMVFEVKEEGKATYSWWTGEGAWWILVEGLGGFKVYTPPDYA